MRFERFSGRGCVNCEIPYVSELTVKKPKDIKNCIAKKIGTLNIMCPLNDDLKKFVEKTKPIFIKIKEGKLDENNIKNTKIVYNMENKEIIF